MSKTSRRKFYLIAVDMGYGHQRAAYPFAAWAQGGVINANNYDDITNKEKKLWLSQRGAYEFISAFKKVPLLGELVFKAMDSLQDIAPLYPKRDLSPSSWQQQFFLKKVRRGLGKKLTEKLNKNPLPILTTFFVPVYFLEYFGYRGPIYCQICDADINRAWAPLNPSKSRVIYFASTERARQRLLMYGVKPTNIITTGFPLPPENVGDNKKILKMDLKKRLARLDPSRLFINKHQKVIAAELDAVPASTKQAPTLTFAIGGAGAQIELTDIFLPGLKPLLQKKQLKINLVAGARPEIKEAFSASLRRLGLNKNPDVKIIFHGDKNSYFHIFNRCLRTTDILMTKPSELSFYAGLGLPIVMTEIVGAQERENRDWLISLGAGLDAPNLNCLGEWLTDRLTDGSLARAAWLGYQEAENQAVEKIINIINESR